MLSPFSMKKSPLARFLVGLSRGHFFVGNGDFSCGFVGNGDVFVCNNDFSWGFVGIGDFFLGIGEQIKSKAYSYRPYARQFY